MKDTFKSIQIKKVLGYLAILSLLLTVLATLAPMKIGADNTATTTLFSEKFTAYTKKVCMPDGTIFGPWQVVYAGYGCVKVVPNSWLKETPKTAASPGETHAALVTGPTFSTPFKYTVRLKTIAQLRTGSAPNPWEVGWVIWNYTDDSHFYYFIAKPNGWELGKEDPAYPGGQRFLATGLTPTFPIGVAYTIRVAQDGSNTITVFVNNNKILSFTDMENPYTSGQIGLYTEDASAKFTNVVISDL